MIADVVARICRRLRSLPEYIYRTCRRWSYLRYERFATPIVFTLPGGLEVSLHPSGVFPERLYVGLEDMLDYALVGALLRPGMHVVDVGANIGVYTLLADKCVRPDGKVWSFEPSAQSYLWMEKNLALNRASTVSAAKLAVADVHGVELTLQREPGYSDADRYLAVGSPPQKVKARQDDLGDRETVAVTTLDHYLTASRREQSIDFLKIDVEGGEYAVLRGARNLLRENPGLQIMFESQAHHTARTGHTQGDVYNYLRGLGFGMFAWSKDRNAWVSDENALLNALNVWASRTASSLPTPRFY